MKPAERDIASRRRVRATLSLLYLDIDEEDVADSVTRELADSAYSIDELRSILLDEVHPVLRNNLLAPAGVWEGFDQDWLGEQILRRLARPPWLRAPRWFLASMATRIWNNLAPRIEHLRMSSSCVEVGGVDLP